MGTNVVLQKLEYTNRALVFPGDLLTFKGKIGQKGGNGGESYITCQVWAENPKGQILVEGSAIISLG